MIATKGIPILLVVGLALASPAARAQSDPDLVGLFMEGCLPYVGNTAALRQWVTQTGLQPLNHEGQAAFLPGGNGVAYDASTQRARFVLLSGNDGTCSAVAEQAGRARVAAELESAFREAGIGFTMASDTPDPQERQIYHRQYRASAGGRNWQVVVSGPDSGAQPIMITASEEPPPTNPQAPR